MPDARMHPELHARKASERAAMFSLLSPRARLAWESWVAARGQVRILNPSVTDADDIVVTLDLPATATAMDWHGVPHEERAWTWARVQDLHDIAYHGARNIVGACLSHGVTDTTEIDPDCEDCMAMVSDGPR